MIERKKLETALNEFIDYYRAIHGILHCISLLVEQCGFTKEDLLELGFGEVDINKVIEEPESVVKE